MNKLNLYYTKKRHRYYSPEFKKYLTMKEIANETGKGREINVLCRDTQKDVTKDTLIRALYFHLQDNKDLVSLRDLYFDLRFIRR